MVPRLACFVFQTYLIILITRPFTAQMQKPNWPHIVRSPHLTIVMEQRKYQVSVEIQSNC